MSKIFKLQDVNLIKCLGCGLHGYFRKILTDMAKLSYAFGGGRQYKCEICGNNITILDE